MKQYNENNISLVTNSFIFDNLNDRDLSISDLWSSITKDEVVYIFKDYKNVECLVLNRNVIPQVCAISSTGKLSVPLFDSSIIDFAKAIDNMIFSLCMESFKKSILSFNIMKVGDVKNYIKKEDGGFYCNKVTADILGINNIFNVSLPNGIIMFVPNNGFTGIIPYTLDNDNNLLTFGINIVIKSVKFINIEEL